jgi:D-sedoheptulose 7-phosphate isomerase
MTASPPGAFDFGGPPPPVSTAQVPNLECVVLCGGLGGCRDAALVDLPTVLTDVAGRPFIEWVLLGLRRNGVTDVLLATGRRGDEVEARLADGGHLGLRIRYSHEPAPLGTAGALRFALSCLGRGDVLVVNGDTYCDVPVRRMASEHRRHRGRVTVLASHVLDRASYGALEVGAEGRVLSFGEKVARGPGLVSCGAYIFSRGLLEDLPDSRHVDIEAEVLPRLDAGQVYAVVGSGPFMDIGSADGLARATEAIRAATAPARLRSRGTALGHVRSHLQESAGTMQRVADRCASSIVAAAELLADTFTAGGKLLLCGNGGSAADCQHVAAEFVSRLDRSLDRAALPAIALTTDTSFLTAYANDVDFDGVFARQVEALGRPGDVLLAISTSGGSRNVRAAVEAARRRHMRVVGLFGDASPLADSVDVAVEVPSHSTQVIQECMLAIEHSICEVVEQVMYGTADVDSDDELAAS